MFSLGYSVVESANADRFFITVFNKASIFTAITTNIYLVSPYPPELQQIYLVPSLFYHGPALQTHSMQVLAVSKYQSTIRFTSMA